VLEAERQRPAALEAEHSTREQAEAPAEPVRRPAAPPRAAPPLAVPRSPSEVLVLLADDSKVVRVKSTRVLTARGFRVVSAEDGEQALALCEREAPHVVLTDVEMPHVDGFELTRRLRADPRFAAVPILMITSADDRLREAALAAGVDVLLGKPYADDDLIGHVERLSGVAATATA
jgi:CheY-like chemotaxis protein